RSSSIFLFQSEEGRRSRNVTGVQTCALPIFGNPGEAALLADMGAQVMHTNIVWPYFPLRRDKGGLPQKDADALRKLVRTCHDKRSEERRVGKEHRARWAPYARIEIIALPAEG